MIISVNVRADEKGDILENDNSVVKDELNRGEYVICVEDCAETSAQQTEDMEEITVTSDSTLCESDLSDSQLQQLEQTENVQIEKNIFLFGAESDNTTENDIEEICTEWNYQMIRADKVSRETDSKRAPVKVAVLDSGIELLSGIPVSSSINLVKEEQDLPYYMNDMVGHGTAVADIIYQICPNTQIYSVRVLDKDNKGRLSDIVQGIYWCIERGVDIINMSFGTWNHSEILQEAIQAASNQGILIVASAGNSGGDTSSLTKVKGQDTECYESMKDTVTLSHIFDAIYPANYDPASGKAILRHGHTWDYLIHEKTGLSYSSQNASTQKRWRKALLYGMAIHTATDAFAHCCYYKNSAGQMQRLDHDNGADNKKISENRFFAAGYTAEMIVDNYFTNSVGDILDFTAHGQTYWKNFFLGNILNYALQANKDYDTADVNRWFKDVNYTFN